MFSKNIEAEYGHIRSGLEWSISIVDHKAVSMKVVHSSMDVTDEIFSMLDQRDILSRIGDLGSDGPVATHIDISATRRPAWRARRGP